MATKKEVSALITLLEETYHVKDEYSDGAVLVYHKVLEDIPFEVLEAAALEHIANSQWFPKPSELRQKAMSYSIPQIPSALEGWGEVQAEIRRVGYMGRPQFANPVTARCVESLGWKYLCLSEDLMADRAHFLKAYDQVSSREQRDRVLLPEVSALAKRLTAGGQR